MKKLVSLLLLAAMMCAILVPALAEYPEVVEGIDFGGATIYIYDYWSGDGARVENPNEEHTLGLFFFTEGVDKQIELLQLDKSGIKVAQYLTELPSKELLQRQLHKGLEAARQRWENRQED